MSGKVTLVVDGVFVKLMGGETKGGGKEGTCDVFDLSSVFHCITVCSAGSVGRGHC